MRKLDEYIEEGDQVLVCYADGQNQEAEVLHVPGGAAFNPAGAEDMWHFKTKEGGVYYQNPSSMMLEMIRLVSKRPVILDAF